MSLWNDPKAKGIFTNAAGAPFTAASETAVMALKAGNNRELLTAKNRARVPSVEKLALVFYAMGNNGVIKF